MTPEQMIALADRLRTLAGVGRWFDRSAATAGATASFESDVHAAADLIRQMAESEPFVWYDDDTGETYTPGAVKDGGCPDGLRPLYAAPPAPQPDDSPLADLDWERLRARESRALDPDHQWAFDLIRGAPQPARVPMTECEASHLIAKAFESAKDVDSKSLSREIARAVERHHGIRSEE